MCEIGLESVLLQSSTLWATECRSFSVFFGNVSCYLVYNFMFLFLFLFFGPFRGSYTPEFQVHTTEEERAKPINASKFVPYYIISLIIQTKNTEKHINWAIFITFDSLLLLIAVLEYQARKEIIILHYIQSLHCLSSKIYKRKDYIDINTYNK